MLKILSVSTFENAGGAARSAHRLHCGLRNRGVDSSMLVQYKNTIDPSIMGSTSVLGKLVNSCRPYIDAIPILFYRSHLAPPWSVSWLPKKISGLITSINPDIIHLHWINHGFLPISEISSFKKPIIWTFHDSWAFTGGCCLPGDCERFKERCGRCPQLNSKSEYDLSRLIWWRKYNQWSDIEMTIVTPSHWLAKMTRASSLFADKRIEVIPNGIDIELYKVVEKCEARSLLGLPQNKTIILFGAANFSRDTNKGANILDAALGLLKEQGYDKTTELLLFGEQKVGKLLQNGYLIHNLGVIEQEEKLACIYAAADIFVLPSVQENLPNTVLESMSCGTPCVAFRVGGVPEIIDHKINGYLAEPFSIKDLASGIAWSISNNNRNAELSRHARMKVELHFNIDSVVTRYLELYQGFEKHSD